MTFPVDLIKKTSGLKSQILNLLSTQSMSMEELSNRLGLQVIAVRHHVNSLKNLGLVGEAEYIRGRVGRPTVRYKLADVAKFKEANFSDMLWLYSYFTRPVSTVMRRSLFTVEKDDTVLKALEIMKDNSVGSVLVTDQGKPIGMVTERDVTFKVSSKDLLPSKVRVGEIASTPLISIGVGANIHEAVEVMAKNQLRRLVVEENGVPVGLVAQRFIMDALIAENAMRSFKIAY